MAGERPSPPGASAPRAGCVDDALLVARARVDRRAFGPLYERYVGPVYRYCYRRLGSREAAEDATSQVFAKALAALPRYREDATFRSWLFAIAHNVVVDAHRRARPDEPLAVAGDPADEALTPEELVVAADERRAIWALLATLPDGQRAVVELRVAGLTHVEIAAALERSHASVRTLQSRAIARLRQELVLPIDATEAGDAER